MFLIRTRVGRSAIHGNGVFACETVRQGQLIWRYEALFDREIKPEDLVRMPLAFREYVEMYAYRSSDLNGQLILSSDHAKFLNHSSDPNTSEIEFGSIAKRHIAIDDEITCDYGAFCTDFSGFENEALNLALASQSPHANLYTRLMPSINGIGVFAIRDIPEGTPLFDGDITRTVAVSQSDVDSLADQNIRQLYVDFCPLKDGYFIAPVDLNQLTMSWYLNHSDQPNVAINSNLTFITSRLITKGEELRSDYRTYSAHAARHIENWKSMTKALN